MLFTNIMLLQVCIGYLFIDEIAGVAADPVNYSPVKIQLTLCPVMMHCS